MWDEPLDYFLKDGENYMNSILLEQTRKVAWEYLKKDDLVCKGTATVPFHRLINSSTMDSLSQKRVRLWRGNRGGYEYL